MNTQDLVKTFGACIILVLMQLLFFKNLVLFEVAFCFIYILAIIRLPGELGTGYVMLASFFIGLTVDIYYNTAGVHSSACTLIGFLRKNLLRYFFPTKGIDNEIQVSLKELGFQRYFVYVLIMVSFHHILLFMMEAGGFSHFLNTLLKIVCSIVFTTIMVLLTSALATGISSRQKKLRVRMKAIAAVMLMLASVLLSCKGGGSNVNLPKTDSLAILRKLDSIRIEIKASKKHREIKAVVDRKIANGFNGNIMVSQRGVVLFDTCVGYANFDKKIPNTPNSAFQLASLSKTFTSAAVMLLVEKGQLNLNNTVQDYYPEFPYSGVTLRSLLSHRSGLPYYEYVFDVKTRSEKLYPNNQDMMRWFAETKPAPKIHNLPDHYFGYNNTNFAILAAIVEKVSKKDFAHFLEEEIFKPLGMNSSFAATQLNDSLLTKNRTFGYQYNRLIPFDQYDNILGDKGVFSTISDLLKWDRALKSNVLLNKESLREMYTPRSFEHPGLRNYGYGFRLWLNEKQQTDYVYHTGWWKGYNTIMFMDLRDDFVIIVLSNRYNKDVYHIKEIIDIVHGGKKETSVQENILDE